MASNVSIISESTFHPAFADAANESDVAQAQAVLGGHEAHLRRQALRAALDPDDVQPLQRHAAAHPAEQAALARSQSIWRLSVCLRT